MDMIKAEPHEHIVDIWPYGLNELQRMAYKLCIDSGLIRIASVKTDPATRYTTIQYMSTIPEEWIHDTLRACFEENYNKFLLATEKVEQLKMDEEIRNGDQ